MKNLVSSFLLVTVLTLALQQCTKDFTPIDLSPSPCPEKVSYTPVDVSQAPAGKLFFSIVLDSFITDSIYDYQPFQPRQLFMMNPDGSNLVKIISFSNMVRLPTLSPDGNRIVYSSWDGIGPGIGTEYVYVYNRLDSSVVRLTNFPYEPLAFSWSPNRDKVAFIRCVDCEAFGSTHKNYIIDLQRNEVYQLNNTPASEGLLSWSPSGGSVIYDEWANNHKDLFIEDISTRAKIPVTCTEESESIALWSPDGSRIAFVSDSRLFELQLNNLSKKRLILNDNLAPYSSWSPDGQYILSHTRHSIYKIDIQDGKLTPVLSLPDPRINEPVDYIETVQWIAIE